MTVRKLLILGAGYSGKELIRRALHSNYQVVATSRTSAHVEALRAMGIEALRWSADEELPFLEHLGADTAVVYSVPTIFKEYQGGPTLEETRHVAPVRAVFEACLRAGVPRFIYLSSTSVYGDHHGQWVDETEPLTPASPYGRMRADIETYLQATPVEMAVSIARLAGIYGPGRSLLERMESGSFTLVEDGKKVTNRIHVHDIARGILALIEEGPKEAMVFNFTDGHPQLLCDLVEFICAETGLTLPPSETLEQYSARVQNPNAVSRMKSMARVRNDRLRRELEFSLTYPDVFSGYQDLINAYLKARRLAGEKSSPASC